MLLHFSEQIVFLIGFGNTFPHSQHSFERIMASLTLIILLWRAFVPPNIPIASSMFEARHSCLTGHFPQASRAILALFLSLSPGKNNFVSIDAHSAFSFQFSFSIRCLSL